MTIPSVIVADEVPVGSAEPHGIFYKVRQIVTNNNILNYIQPSTNYPTSSSVDTIVKWDGYFTSQNNQNAYLLIDFKNRFIFPTHYSMKGSNGMWFSKKWILYGLNSLDESPVEITRNTSVGSTFCGDVTTCGDNKWGTFMIKYPTRAFRYLKMISLVSSHSSYWYIAMEGFEVFGILSEDGRTSPTTTKTFYLRSCQMNCHLPAYAFIRLFSVFIS
jgi:hypothetical protein